MSNWHWNYASEILPVRNEKVEVITDHGTTYDAEYKDDFRTLEHGILIRDVILWRKKGGGKE